MHTRRQYQYMSPRCTISRSTIKGEYKLLGEEAQSIESAAVLGVSSRHVYYLISKKRTSSTRIPAGRGFLATCLLQRQNITHLKTHFCNVFLIYHNTKAEQQDKEQIKKIDIIHNFGIINKQLTMNKHTNNIYNILLYCHCARFCKKALWIYNLLDNRTIQDMKTKSQKMSIEIGYKDDEKTHNPLFIRVPVMYIGQRDVLYLFVCIF